MKKALLLLKVLVIVIVTTMMINVANAQQRRQIIIEQANQMRNLRVEGREIRRLLGDVIIRHEDVTMKCDSAYEYMGTNRFDAFGRVVVIQNTITLYGDTLRYDGNTKKGRVRGKVVRLVDEDATLITRFIDFDTNQNTAVFYNGGIITTSDSRFSSKRGTYFSNQKKFAFAGDVRFLDPDILLNTDSLEYFSNEELFKFYGPTRIYNEDNYLYSERGWYNKTESKSEFFVNAYIDNATQRVFGNRIFYDRTIGFAEIVGNGCIIDTSRNFTIYGNLIKYFEETEVAEVMDNPLAIYFTEEGDSLFLRADLLKGISIKDSIHSDSTLYRLLKGIGNVRFYRNDLQGVADSMVFHSVDSILHMYNEPIIWNEDNQLTANNISILFKNENIHRMFFNGSAFITSQEDDTRFNQIKGREMIGYFTQSKLTRLDVNGNGETVYFGRDQGVISMVNKAESSRLTISISDNKVTNIMFREKPSATLFPIEKVELQDVMLRGFAWHIAKRPVSKEDIIPNGLNINFYIPIENTANQLREKRENPAESLDQAGLKKVISSPIN